MKQSTRKAFEDYILQVQNVIHSVSVMGMGADMKLREVTSRLFEALEHEDCDPE